MVTPAEVGREAYHHLQAYLLRPARWRPLPHQVPPAGSWFGWILASGRGSGKTDACANYIAQHVSGPPCVAGPAPHWVGIIAPTLGDAVTACWEGPSGLRKHAPDARLVQTSGGTVIRWPNGSVAKIFGASNPEDVERLRAGGGRCAVWLEELAAWRYLDACFDQMRFGLRLGPRPHWVASTTPKPRKLIIDLVRNTPHDVVLTRATTDDNPHLPAHIRAALYETYGGRRLGRQELYAELVEQDENALWTREQLDEFRLAEVPAGLRRITVGVDPSGGAGEQGIIVSGKTIEPVTTDGKTIQVVRGYTLYDASCTLAPRGWGRRAVRAAIDWEADDLVVEKNFGGDMATGVLLDACDELGVPIPVRAVSASRGKRVRAEPVSALAARGRWHQVGYFPELETQLTTWVPEESDYSPDRLDAMVWGGWHLRLVTLTPRGLGTFGGSAMRNKIA